MRKRLFGKALAVVAGAVVAMAMSATVFAATEVMPSTGVYSESGAVKIEKNLKAYNDTLDSVASPGVKFDFTVAPNQGTTATITDTNGNSAVVKDGVAGGLTLDVASVEWAKNTPLNASSSGADNKKYVETSVDASKFSAPGVYRYKITTSHTPADLTEIGVNDSTDEFYYVDVYIENGAGGLECKGIVMMDDSGAKGLFPASEFATVNMTLKKTITGSMADKNHEFPFAGTVSDNGRYFYAKKGEAPTAIDANKNTTGSVSTTLKDNEEFYIYGVSTRGKATIIETNDTADTYTTTVSGMATAAASAVAPNGTKSSGEFDADDGTVTFNNNLDAVSPTGVVMRYGAPILLLLAGLAFVAIRRRNAVDAE